MVKLPGGFSPIKAVQQIGSYVNPTGGTADYDVFSDYGKQRGGSQLPDSAYNGSTGYWDGQAWEYRDGGWSPVGGNTSGNTDSPLGGGASTGSGGGSSSPSYSQEDLAYLDNQMSLLDRQYGRTGTTLRDALDAVLQNYNKELSSANTTRSRNLEDFSMKTQQSEMGRERELGKVDTSARMLANSLRQRLGLAGGTSSAQGVAGQAVAREASENRGDVLSDYAANFQALDTNKRRSTEDFESLLSELNKQKTQREGGVHRDIAEQRNEIESNRAQVAAEKAKLLGGGYTGVRQAMSPYEQKIQQGESLIDSIYSKYAAKYDVKPLVERKTNLRDYAVDKTAVRDQAATGEVNPNAPYQNPYKEDEQNVGVY